MKADDLVARLLAHLDKVEQTALAAAREVGTRDDPEGLSPWVAAAIGGGVHAESGASVAVGAFGYMDDEVADHIAAQDPATTLRLVRAHRDIVERYRAHVVERDALRCEQVANGGLPLPPKLHVAAARSDESLEIIRLLARGYGLQEDQG